MFDKNELRTSHKEMFATAIERFRERFCRDGRESAPDLAVCTLRPSPRAVRVYVRKRPLFEHEEQKGGDFDVASITAGTPLTTHMVLHNCVFQADLKTPLIHHLHFDFDHVFGEETQDSEVYRLAASDLVVNALEGGAGTILMFGQTGSGKTHTMTAIEGLAARDLFDEDWEGPEPQVLLEFVEIRGAHCYDLLRTPGGRGAAPELRLRETPEGLYVAEGATQLRPQTVQELQSAIRAAHGRRATASTTANTTSSRSHAVCTLRIPRSGGQLTLADCAGTERKKDSMYHSKERQQEGAEINASLYALKECVRYAAARQRVPPHAYRASPLTKLLAAAFTRGEASLLAVICTASPCASDTEHTLATLRTGAALGGFGAERQERESLPPVAAPPREPHPKQWTPEQVRAWCSGIDDGRFQDVANTLPSNFTGQMLVRVTEARCVQLCGGSERRGQRLFELLHEEIRRAERLRRAISQG